jgi:hypothetical protein
VVIFLKLIWKSMKMMRYFGRKERKLATEIYPGFTLSLTLAELLGKQFLSPE